MLETIIAVLALAVTVGVEAAGLPLAPDVRAILLFIGGWLLKRPRELLTRRDRGDK